MAQYVAWVELVVISLITPNASFLGHLVGILAGLLHLTLFDRDTGENVFSCIAQQHDSRHVWVQATKA